MGHMQYKSNVLNPLPRLILEKPSATSKDMVGYLETKDEKKIRLGDATSKEFLLMQCLFSPSNFLSARFDPVAQTYERLFSAMYAGADVLQTKVSDQDGRVREVASRVEEALTQFRRGAVGKCFTFTSKEGRVRMDAIVPVPVLVAA
jgi:hypothetical protein